MKTIITKSVIFAIFLSGLTLISCRTKGDTVAKIRILDQDGSAISNAMVRLYPTPTILVHGAIVIDDTLFTNNEGYATFNYSDNFNLGQAGFAVLDIEARNSDGLLFGEGIIKIEPEKTTEETVILQ